MAVVTTDQVAAGNSRGDKRAVGRAVFTSAVTALVVGISCMAAITLFPEQILASFQTNAEMMEPAKTYAVIRAISTPAALVMVASQAAFLALLDLRTPLLVVVSAGALNAMLDPILMFKLNMGIAGAAWATSISQIAGAIAFVALIYRRRRDFGVVVALEEAATRVHGAAAAAAMSLPSKVVCLLKDLGWGAYLKRCRTLALRAVLILSTYTMAAITATNLGTVFIAAHQVINQLQQLQLNVTWAFLSVGQTMTANVYGSKGAGPARRVANRVIFWGATVSAILGVVTWVLRDLLPRIFIQVRCCTALPHHVAPLCRPAPPRSRCSRLLSSTLLLRLCCPLAQDPAVLSILQTAMLPACVMLAFSWNNALEGCLLGADDGNYVVGTYPWAVSAGLLVLGASYKMGFGLAGIWWSLAVYYAALVTWFGSRFVVPWNRGTL